MAMISNIWNRIFGARQTKELRYPETRSVAISGRTQAGVYITPDRALLNDTVWACRRYISESCGQLPAKIVKQVGGKQVIVDVHPVDTVLNYRPNPELSPFGFRETMVGWAVTHGNGVAEIETDAVGRVVNLWPIHPNRIRFLRDLDTGELIYRIFNGTNTDFTDLRSKEVFHIRGFGDTAVGMSVAEYAAQTIGYAKAAELFGASFFGEGMHFGGTAIFPGKADADTIERQREELESVYKGPTRAGRWFVGDGDVKITRMTSTPDEAQFLETMQFQVESICRWFGVPPHKVGHLLRMTFNNVEQLSIDAVGQCIAPWAMRLAEEATYKLFGGNRLNLQVVFDLKGLLRGDFKTRQEGLQIQRRNGIITSADWAQLEDIPEPKTGGDIYIVESNMQTLDQLKVGKQPSTNTNTNTNTGTNTDTSVKVPANDFHAAVALSQIDSILNQVLENV